MTGLRVSNDSETITVTVGEVEPGADPGSGRGSECR